MSEPLSSLHGPLIEWNVRPRCSGLFFLGQLLIWTLTLRGCRRRGSPASSRPSVREMVCQIWRHGEAKTAWALCSCEPLVDIWRFLTSNIAFLHASSVCGLCISRNYWSNSQTCIPVRVCVSEDSSFANLIPLKFIQLAHLLALGWCEFNVGFMFGHSSWISSRPADTL